MTKAELVTKISENLGLEKQLLSSLVELIEGINVEKPRDFKSHNINQIDICLLFYLNIVFDL